MKHLMLIRQIQLKKITGFRTAPAISLKSNYPTPDYQANRSNRLKLSDMYTLVDIL